MGREIVSISVPIGSLVWHRIQAWKEDEETNVSLAICDCISDNGLLIDRIESLRRKLNRIAVKTASSPHTIDKETWEDELSQWVNI